MILVGSFAAKHHDDTWARPKDIDFIATFDDFSNFIKKNNLKAIPLSGSKYLTRWLGFNTEVEIAWPGSSGEDLIKKVSGEEVDFYGEKVILPSLNWLFTLKSSHKYLKNSPFFLKTMADYFYLKDDLGCSIVDEEWLAKREEETYAKTRPKLNKSKNGFFSGDGISYKYDHDTVHESVMHLDKPAYMFYKEQGGEIQCSKSLWDVTSDKIKKYGVLEESYVLALERSQIPFQGHVSPRTSFIIALRKICTSISSGWFREFAYENYPEIVSMYKPDYVEKFKKDIESGLVKPFQEICLDQNKNL